jgi:glucose-1-phosphatase
MKKLVLALAAAAILLSCSQRHYSPAQPGEMSARTFMERPDGFHGRYTLEEVVVLSRHNIRSPLSGKGSVLSRITPHEWFEWTSAPGELSRKGAILETQMGQFFRLWLISEGLMEENERPQEGEMRFYANSLQRTVATAQYFSSGMLPVANVTVERHCPLGTMDPTFNPRITRDDAGWRSRAIVQMGRMNDGRVETLGDPMAGNYAVLERVLDIKDSPAARNDTTAIPLGDLAVQLVPFCEPTMTGGLKMAYSASDALVLQYYEEPDLQRAAFGHRISRKDWESIATIKDWYGDVLFTTPAVAANVARPLLETILSELKMERRRFCFLCGHDSNIGSVLAALRNEDYEAPLAIERKTPIGSKVVFAKWRGKDGRLYVDVHLVYASDTQLREMPMLSLQAPPVSLPIRFKGLTPNADGLYGLSDLEQRLQEAIAAEPPTGTIQPSLP